MVLLAINTTIVTTGIVVFLIVILILEDRKITRLN